jgi:molecular chaperone GrpE (heat shock protein)
MADVTETDQLQDLRDENARLKEQVAHYEQDQIVQIRGDIANLRQGTERDIADLREDLYRDIAGLRQDTQRDIADLRQDLHREITDLKQGEITDLRQDVKVLTGKVDKILYAVIITLVGIAGLIIESVT